MYLLVFKLFLLEKPQEICPEFKAIMRLWINNCDVENWDLDTSSLIKEIQ